MANNAKFILFLFTLSTISSTYGMGMEFDPEDIQSLATTNYYQRQRSENFEEEDQPQDRVKNYAQKLGQFTAWEEQAYQSASAAYLASPAGKKAQQIKNQHQLDARLWLRNNDPALTIQGQAKQAVDGVIVQSIFEELMTLSRTIRSGIKTAAAQAVLRLPFSWCKELKKDRDTMIAAQIQEREKKQRAEAQLYLLQASVLHKQASKNLKRDRALIDQETDPELKAFYEEKYTIARRRHILNNFQIGTNIALTQNPWEYPHMHPFIARQKRHNAALEKFLAEQEAAKPASQEKPAPVASADQMQ